MFIIYNDDIKVLVLRIACENENYNIYMFTSRTKLINVSARQRYEIKIITILHS